MVGPSDEREAGAVSVEENVNGDAKDVHPAGAARDSTAMETTETDIDAQRGEGAGIASDQNLNSHDAGASTAAVLVSRTGGLEDGAEVLPTGGAYNLDAQPAAVAASNSTDISSYLTKTAVGSVKSLGETLQPYFVLLKEWFRNPIHWAIFVWIIAVACTGALLFMTMVGMLDGRFDKKKKDRVSEITSQILNGLFTFAALVNQPARLAFLVKLIRYRPRDVALLRAAFTKDGGYRPNERKHFAVVIIFLNLNCWFQYPMAILHWVYDQDDRSALGVAVCLTLSFLSAVFAALYNMYCPLGKSDETKKKAGVGAGAGAVVPVAEGDAPPVLPMSASDDDLRQIALHMPQAVAMEPPVKMTMKNKKRLGFSSSFLHALILIVLLVGPFLVLLLASNARGISAKNMMDNVLPILGIIAGYVLAMLYGGHMRTKMRRTFNLPQPKHCADPRCAELGESLTWLVCPFCALCQEIRTLESGNVNPGHKFWSQASMEQHHTDLNKPASLFSVWPMLHSTRTMRRSATLINRAIQEAEEAESRDGDASQHSARSHRSHHSQSLSNHAGLRASMEAGVVGPVPVTEEPIVEGEHEGESMRSLVLTGVVAAEADNGRESSVVGQATGGEQVPPAGSREAPAGASEPMDDLPVEPGALPAGAGAGSQEVDGDDAPRVTASSIPSHAVVSTGE
eukprot:jgi/Mesvir1/23940/Mv10713-RA.2